jgi:hypothetical protein
LAILTAALLIAGHDHSGRLDRTAPASELLPTSPRATLGTTLGTACVATASMIYFSALGTRPVHELLIVVFVTVTAPITLMILVGHFQAEEITSAEFIY